jgi:hypothetical protein
VFRKTVKVEHKGDMMGTVYLAGPIEQVTTDSATTWRDEAAKLLIVDNNLVCDPNRTWVLDPNIMGGQTPHECGIIVEVDLCAVRNVDALLVWCDKNTLMCGTYIEVGYALAHNKPIAFYSPGIFPGFVKGLQFASSSITKGRVALFSDISAACNWILKEIGGTK